jgi:hypothetical protein
MPQTGDLAFDGEVTAESRSRGALVHMLVNFLPRRID